MISIKTHLNKKKFQNFLFIHGLFLIGILTIPADNWYFYDILIFVLFTLPFNSVMQHMFLNHGYIEFKNTIVKTIAFVYLILNNFWKFADAKSYHITHHKLWLDADDPTSKEIHQGLIKYYVGITDPVAIPKIDTKEDQLVTFINRYFYLIKFLLVVAAVAVFGWKIFVHLVIVQQLLLYIVSKIHDVIFHHSTHTKDCPWLFPLYSNDAWHIEHHTEYESMAWHWKPVNVQYFYYKLLFKDS